MPIAAMSVKQNGTKLRSDRMTDSCGLLMMMLILPLLHLTARMTGKDPLYTCIHDILLGKESSDNWFCIRPNKKSSLFPIEGSKTAMRDAVFIFYFTVRKTAMRNLFIN